MIKVLGSSPTLGELVGLINRYFYSKGYYIQDTNIKHISGKDVDYHYSVRKVKNRYQFIYNSRDRRFK